MINPSIYSFCRLMCRKRKGFVAKLLQAHGYVAWFLVMSLTIAFFRTRASLMKQIDSLEEHSSSTHSEMVQKVSRLNNNLVDKNREISDLAKQARQDRTTVSKCETAKRAEMQEKLNCQSDLSDKKSAIARLEKELEDLKAHKSEMEQTHANDKSSLQAQHEAKDSEIQKLVNDVNSLAQQLKETQDKLVSQGTRGAEQQTNLQQQAATGQQQAATGQQQAATGQQQATTGQQHAATGQQQAATGQQQAATGQQQAATGQQQAAMPMKKPIHQPVTKDREQMQQENSQMEEPDQNKRNARSSVRRKGKLGSLSMLKEHMGIHEEEF